MTLGSEVGTLLTTILGVSGSQGPLGVFRLAQDGLRPLVHCPTLWHSSPRFNWGLYNPKSGENLGINAPKILIPGCILGFLAPRGLQGCSRWSQMVPGCWYTVPHYATALPGSIVDFKIPNLAKIWPEMAQKCSFWVVFWGFLAPRGPRGVQVGPRWWQDTGILSHTMPQPYQVPLWALKSQLWQKFGQKCP